MSTELLAIIGVGVGLATLIWRVSRASTEDIEKRAEWKGEVNADRHSFKEFMKGVRSTLDMILLRLPPTTDMGSSPLRLTDFGLAIADAIKADKWADDLAGELAGTVKGMTAYEVQEFCIEYTMHKMTPTEDQLHELQACAFDKGIDVKAVRRVLGLVLRDKILG